MQVNDLKYLEVMLTRVKDLIAELQQLDQEAIVLYAYDEYGNTGVHQFIASGDTLVCCDPDGDYKFTENEDLILRFLGDDDEDYDESMPKLTDTTVQWLPAIKLFSA